jgi:transposase
LKFHNLLGGRQLCDPQDRDGKRGNKYLRKLLIHGAQSALPSLLASATPLGDWLRGLMGRVHKNAATVALANKLARIAWAVLRRAEAFDVTRLAAA